MMRKRGLLFDLDGTLTDSDHLHYAAFNVLLAREGRQLDHQTFRSQVIGRANAEIFAGLYPEASSAEHEKLAAQKEADYRSLAKSLVPLAGLPGLLDLAAARGWVCAVVTNGPRQNAEHSLKALGLADGFKLVISAIELSRSKPDPLPYQEALRRLDLDREHVVGFEDSVSGLKAGVDAGLAMVGITTGLDAAQLIAMGARMAIADYNDPRLVSFIEVQLGG